MNARKPSSPRRHILSLGACAAALAISSTGCGTDRRTASTHTLDWAEGAEAKLSLFVLLQSGGRDAITSEDLAKRASDDAIMKLGSCAKASVDGAKVKYTFSSCSGPWGITGLTGSVDTTYTADQVNEPNDFHVVRLIATDLSLNGQTMTFDLTGANSVSLESTSPDLMFKVSLENTPPEMTGPVGDGKNDWLEGIDGDYGNLDCATPEKSAPAILSGRGFMYIDGDLWTTKVEDGFHRCDTGCPKAGKISAIGDGTVDVSFDGTASAIAKNGRDGTTEKLPLSCAP